MATEPEYPGVYTLETVGSESLIVGVPTAITAFVGQTKQGPIGEPLGISSWLEYETTFGGIWPGSRLAENVQEYFANGGEQAVIVRVAARAKVAECRLPTSGRPMVLIAANPGAWGNELSVQVEAGHNSDGFHLTVLKGELVAESFRDVSTKTVKRILSENSRLLRARSGTRGAPVDTQAGGIPLSGGSDGVPVTDAGFFGPSGLGSLAASGLFNSLVIPNPVGRDFGARVFETARGLCESRGAMFILDPPSSWSTSDDAIRGNIELGIHSSHVVVYFPRWGHGPGAIAGVWARVDGQHGPWRAPAGIDAVLNGAAVKPSLKLRSADVSALDRCGVNAIIERPNGNWLVWGARTLAADPEWKYIPVKRLALFLEQSVREGLAWAVFEPNGEPLYAKIRFVVTDFLQRLFLLGAFQGRSAKDAYFVQCGRETVTQNDLQNGYLILRVGFAPLRPAEFLIFQILLSVGPTL